MHRTTPRFWALYGKLAVDVQKLADKNFDLLRKFPKHPSLHFKKVGKMWSARIGLDHRALALKDGGDFIWVWIGSHEEYNSVLREH
ncbi:MAG: ParE family toxin-like protein [Thermoguttaceae bacterium]